MIGYPSALLSAAMLILVGATVIARGLPARTVGRHRAGHPATVPLAELMPDWPRPAPGQIAVQTFVTCPVCGPDTAATVHGDAALCSEGHMVTSGGA